MFAMNIFASIKREMRLLPFLHRPKSRSETTAFFHSVNNDLFFRYSISRLVLQDFFGIQRDETQDIFFTAQ